jgi:hypothetical protein
MDETLMSDSIRVNKYPIPFARPKPEPKPAKTKKRFVVPRKTKK